MNNSARDDHDHEVDPTGVRALLSGLPDPGPMPDDVVARISESLQGEQQQRAHAVQGAGTQPHNAPGPPGPHHAPMASGTAGPPGQSDGNVVDLDARRRRRWTGGLLAAAAAVAVGTAVVASQLSGSNVPDVVTADASRDTLDRGEGNSADDSAADAPADEPAPAPESDGEVAQDSDDPFADPTDDSTMGAQPDADDGDAAAGDAGFDPLTFGLNGVVELTSDNVQSEVAAWYGESEDDLYEHLDPSLGPAVEADVTSACAASLAGTEAESRGAFVVSHATYNGEDAILFVTFDAAPPALAWVLPASCADGPVEPLVGALDLETN